MKKIQLKKVQKSKVFWLPEATFMTKKSIFGAYNSITRDWNLVKIIDY
jgi:hypothetical protein